MEAITLFKALSDETRFKILTILLEEDHCVCEIVPMLNKSQPTVSIHLKALEEKGIVSSQRDGRKIVYSIAEPRIRNLIEAAQTVESTVIP